MVARIDLNCDLGEDFDAWAPGVDGLDAQLLGIVTSANVACGFHAGDERVMAHVCRTAAARGVSVGAHVSYADRENFGRRFVDVPADELREQVATQVEILRRIAQANGARVAYVKPHGALYNAVVHHEGHARAVVDGIGDLPVVGLRGSAVLALARARGLRTVTEAFADRGYRADGTLVPRGEPGALVTDEDEVAERVLRIATRGLVRGADGRDVAVEAESVCVHSDTPGAVALAARVRSVLVGAGVELRAFA
ncbi:LamB/YcsF family protein [Cellulomonas rhizosphaerae]|uniref:LamB/YcsF family protein n=1 Tax=Cellulomonas rhizosphaerae TaxID=2293719 RepID=A0A413RI94_9CELL|nr:5-oxoprolinase subunit PxpA [Cellulomonas rhizosphaerae]RHA37995.1 LamB/YcsF family protein [Cellulomonas rhizosphaerae]